MGAYKISYFLSAIFIATLAALPSIAADDCAQKFQKAIGPQYGELKPSFKHNSHYTVEIPHSAEIKDQCGLDTCHLHTWASILGDSYKARTGNEISLSTQYWSAKFWLDRSLRAVGRLNVPNAPIDISLVTDAELSLDAIKKFGIIPSSVWNSGDDFQSRIKTNRFNEYLKNMLERGKIAIHRSSSEPEKIKIKEDLTKEIKNLFQSSVGDFPEKFIHEGIEYTPQKFAEKNFPELNRSLKTIIVDHQENIEEIEKKAKQLLDEGQSVFFLYENNQNYISSKGIMTISGFEFPPGAEPLPRDIRIDSARDAGGHIMQLIGYELDKKTGKIIKWKLKNSWGDEWGDQGYYHMYQDYFSTFVKGISYLKNP